MDTTRHSTKEVNGVSATYSTNTYEGRTTLVGDVVFSSLGLAIAVPHEVVMEILTTYMDGNPAFFNTPDPKQDSCCILPSDDVEDHVIGGSVFRLSSEELSKREAKILAEELQKIRQAKEGREQP